jgi:hypothetical protein
MMPPLARLTPGINSAASPSDQPAGTISRIDSANTSASTLRC